jgi:hypothetical protein
MTAKDIDKDADDPYDKTTRARRAAERARQAFDEPRMSIAEQQRVKADILQEENGRHPRMPEQTSDFFANLRSLAQEKFWLLVDAEQRAKYRTQASGLPPPAAAASLEEDLASVSMLALVQAN